MGGRSPPASTAPERRWPCSAPSCLAAAAAGGRRGAGHEPPSARSSRSGSRQHGRAGRGRKELDDRHKREQRRLRTDELRWGLAILAAAYRDRAAAAPRRLGRPSAALDAAQAVHAAGEALIRNPNETLLLQALLLRLDPR